MTANNALRVTETDFDSIKENLKAYLRNQSQFQDFDFEGSGMNILLDVLAYNTHYMAYYLNMVANESFLDTSQLRSSIVSHAKAINYTPESAHAATTLLNIVVTPTPSESTDSIVTLGKYTRLLGSDIDGVNYPFVTVYSNTASKINGSFTFNNINIKQGEVITLQYLMDAQNTKRRFRISSSTVDIDTLSVVVQESTTNTQTTEWVLADDVTLLTGDSRVYFIEENIDGTYTVSFGDDVIGKKPSVGNVIILTYIDTVGSAANKISNFTFSDRIGGLFADNVSITAVSATYGGSERETNEEIRSRAPHSYVTQNRAVTKHDYEALLVKDFSNIDSISVWGGEENDPPVYGKVFLSLKTKDDYFLTNVEKEAIKERLIATRNVLTVTPEIVDPSYLYLLLRGRVYYNTEITSNTVDMIKSFVRAAILDYETDSLDTFSSIFRKSKMQQYVESSDASITGSDIRVLVQKRVTLTLNQTKNYSVDFGTPIKKGEYNYAISTYPRVKVLDKNFIERLVLFEEVPSIASGIEGFKITNSGINYSEAPTVTIIGDGTGATAIARVSGGRLTSIEMTNKGTNYTRATAVLTGSSGAGASIEAILETRMGKLRSYYIKDNGEKTFVNENAGTIDYNSGLITLLSLGAVSVEANDYYKPNVLTINVPIDTEIISPLKNRILDIDQNDPLSIQIEVMPE